MVIKGIVKACIISFVFLNAMADTGVIMLSPKDSIRRTEWETMGGGWAPPPMPAPKILLLKNQESEGGDKKEEKIDMLLPIIMSLGPIILIAILLPVFMSLLSGIMGFVKSLLAMKMMPMMPANMMMPNGAMPTATLFDNLQKHVIFAGRNHNSTYMDSISQKADDSMLPKNMTIMKLPGLF